MKEKLKISSILLLFFLLVQNTHALEISEISAEAYLHGEYNRTSFMVNFSTIGNIEFGNLFSFRSGLSLGGTIGGIDIGAFVNANITPFPKVPFEFSLYWIYHGIPEYRANVHSILPFISFKAKYFGISAGMNFRLSDYFGYFQNEYILTILIYCNFVYTDTLRIGLSAGNFNDFEARNMGAIYYKLNSKVIINENWSIINNLEYMQSGIDGLTSTFYGINLRTGVKYSW